jgi:hypothetical protein
MYPQYNNNIILKINKRKKKEFNVAENMISFSVLGDQTQGLTYAMKYLLRKMLPLPGKTARNRNTNNAVPIL